MRSQLRVLLVTLFLGPLAVWGPRVVDRVARLETFAISKVDVRGTRYLAQDAVVAQLGLGQFASVWGDREAWTERLTEHPLIRTAEVRRRLPNALRITVEERRPVAFAAAPTLEPVDADGVRLPIDPTRFPLDLPVISTSRVPPRDAHVFPEEVRTLAAEIDRLASLDEEFVQRISTVRRLEDGAIGLLLVTPEVEFLLPQHTTLDRLREGQAALTHAIGHDPGEVPSVVDLRFAGQIVVRRAR